MGWLRPIVPVIARVFFPRSFLPGRRLFGTSEAPLDGKISLVDDPAVQAVLNAQLGGSHNGLRVLR
jgi:hypothetical protein